jgi:cysteinyl-tRNA synthetase
MNFHIFGDSIDIHGGGNDLIFPHHENEIAQSESFTGKPFARYWVHNGMLQLRGEKMSKSIGNIISIDEFLTLHSADSFRYLILNSSYRNPIIFSTEAIESAEKGLDRLRSALKPAAVSAAGASVQITAALNDQMEKTESEFIAAMDDDFNSAGALGTLFELVRVINFARDSGASADQLGSAQMLMKKLTGVFGLTLDSAAANKSDTAEPFIDLLVSLRQEMRKQKNWALADQIRDDLAALKVVVEDTREGSSWHWA